MASKAEVEHIWTWVHTNVDVSGSVDGALGDRCLLGIEQDAQAIFFPSNLRLGELFQFSKFI